MATKTIERAYERINITLPSRTIKLIDRVTEKGERSRIIDTAVVEYIKKTAKGNLRKRLKEGAIRNAPRDLALAGEWFSLDEEAWQKNRE